MYMNKDDNLVHLFSIFIFLDDETNSLFLNTDNEEIPKSWNDLVLGKKIMFDIKNID